MYHVVLFDHGTTGTAIREAIAERFGFDPDRVFAGTRDELRRVLKDGAPYPAVTVMPEGDEAGQFRLELETSDEFASAVHGMDELTLATVLCKALGVRALVDDGCILDTCYMMVTPDGWHGRILVDDDLLNDGIMTLDCALQPVPSDPSIPVSDEPVGADWYRDGKVPESGYVFPADAPGADARQ